MIQASHNNTGKNVMTCNENLNYFFLKEMTFHAKKKKQLTFQHEFKVV